MLNLRLQRLLWVAFTSLPPGLTTGAERMGGNRVEKFRCNINFARPNDGAEVELETLNTS
jgi:hypothetical protein